MKTSFLLGLLLSTFISTMATSAAHAVIIPWLDRDPVRPGRCVVALAAVPVVEVAPAQEFIPMTVNDTRWYLQQIARFLAKLPYAEGAYFKGFVQSLDAPKDSNSIIFVDARYGSTSGDFAVKATIDQSTFMITSMSAPATKVDDVEIRNWEPK